MVATLTDSEWPKLPSVVLGSPMSTKVDALKPHPSIASAICSLYDAEWKTTAHLMNRIFPVGLQISTAQKWFAGMHATVSRQCCTTSWVCVWLRWFDRYLVEKIRELDQNAVLETHVNGRGLKPNLSWCRLGSGAEELDKLYKDMKDAQEGNGLYVQADDMSYYDQTVCADLLCSEPAPVFKIRPTAAERPVRPWSNCYTALYHTQGQGYKSRIDARPGQPSPPSLQGR
ncbi:unnamed protein product [Haemonchus placei]|uniref:Reverse transcriptase domain-containing protein n=1 Tax=Haemonchus placei TaxID=6290 RepID=A0A0N4WUS8_HAEPC|nr:unnamed protein product [Haemonchus placei]